MVTTGGTNLKDDILRLTEPGKYVEAMILSLFSGMGHLRIFPEFRIIFFYLRGKKKLSPASWLFFCLGKIGGIIRHYCRPATKYKISRSIRISRFHVWKSQVFVLFRNWKKKKASHFVACLQAHKAWAKNKFYDRLNWRPWLNPLHTATQRVR